MSFLLSGKVWHIENLSTTERLVLLALADTAHDNGECWPGLGYIAMKCGFSEKSRAHLSRVLKDLSQKGHLRIEPRKRADKARASNMYVLTLDDVAVPTRGVAVGTRGCSGGDKGVDENVVPTVGPDHCYDDALPGEPVIEPVSEAVRTPRAAENEPETATCPYQAMMDEWNVRAKPVKARMVRKRDIDDSRKKKMRAHWNEWAKYDDGGDAWVTFRAICEAALTSEYLLSDEAPYFGFWWLFDRDKNRTDNWKKIIEGNYRYRRKDSGDAVPPAEDDGFVYG